MSREYNVSIGDDEVAIKRKGSSEIITAKILGRDLNETGQVLAIWLDRRVHTKSDDRMGDWSPEGAVVTVLIANRQHPA